MGLPSTALAALPWICPVLSHQEVNLPSHFHVVDPPACFIALPLAAAAGLLIVAPSLYDFSKPISSEDSGQGPVCTFHVPLLNHHSPGNELQVFSHDFTFKSSFSRTYRLDKRHGNRKISKKPKPESHFTTGTWRPREILSSLHTRLANPPRNFLTYGLSTQDSRTLRTGSGSYGIPEAGGSALKGADCCGSRGCGLSL